MATMKAENNFIFMIFANNLTDNSGHSGGITSLDCHEDNILALSGSVDGTANLLNTTNGKVCG